MASELKPSGFYIFDQQQAQTAVLQKEERPGLAKRVRIFLRSRYALLSAAFLLAGSLIFYNTAALQLNPSAASGISETTGIARQQTIKAARGDILDASGIPLAYSRTINTVEITYAGLEDTQLNAMLLDLYKFLEANQVEIVDTLSEYFTLNHEDCGHAESEGDDCGKPAFTQDADEIAYWQNDSDLFNLALADEDETTSFADDLVKSDPQVFYDYLLYVKFKIEDPDADGQRYSRTDAYRIMQLRYLIMENRWAFLNGTPLEIARDVTEKVVSVIDEQNYRFIGVITGQDTERVYTDDASSLSHVLGYVGRITSSQYEDLKSQGYSADAIVGQAGVEFTAERYLAGQDGIKPYNIWTVAGEAGTFFSEKIGKDAIPGYNVRLTIDLDLQKTAESALKRVIDEIRNSPDNQNKGDADAGSVVMLDVKTGAVLAMVSYPSYDPNDFILQTYDKAAAARVEEYLTDNVNKPMWNRAIMEIYAPGSTFKPATAVAALESGAITPTSSIIRCKGHEVIGDWLWHCLERPGSGHGNLTLRMALATSCNMYFYNLGVRTGINNIDYWGQKLGLGEYTGIDLPGEAKGIRSSRTTKKLLRSNPEDQIWFPADTCQTAIGQFDNSFTILQLAVYASSLATGNKVTPHVISEITRNDGVIIKNSLTEAVPIGLQESTLKAVREGMIDVANDPQGTAYRYFKDFPIKVAAKTGTAETGYEDTSSSNGLFICYAPADNPQVAIAQIVEKGAWGSNTVGIAKDLLTAYFGLDSNSGEDLEDLPGLPDEVITPETSD